MKRYYIIIVTLLSAYTLPAQQSKQDILTQIEENNTTLQALRQTAEAEKLENKTGIWLENPQVEFNYLWGTPGEIGHRKDVRATQSFDIPTITGMKNRLANEQNRRVDLQYKADRINILLEAQQYLIELVYYNTLRGELETRLQHAQTIAEGYSRSFEQGETNILEYNKVKLNLSTVQGEIARVEVEQQALLSELRRLNGGIDIQWNSTTYTDDLLPIRFADWYKTVEQQNPVLAAVNQDIELAKKQLAVNRAQGLPTFNAGYMREKVVGETYQGLTLGVSIPLWENKNRVKQAKTAIKAAEIRQEDTRLQFYSRLNNQYERAYGLQQTAIAYRSALANLNSTELLKKALDAGQISLLEYIMEVSLYYDTINLALEAERDYRLAYAELAAVTL